MARTSAIAAMVLLALLLGCPPEEEPEPDPCEGVSAAMTLTDEHNYTFEGALDIESTPVAPLTDITLDFSGLQHDLLGHDLDPTSELDMASAIVFNLTEDEVEYGLSTGTLDQVHVTIFSSQETAGETNGRPRLDAAGRAGPGTIPIAASWPSSARRTTRASSSSTARARAPR